LNEEKITPLLNVIASCGDDQDKLNKIYDIASYALLYGCQCKLMSVSNLVIRKIDGEESKIKCAICGVVYPKVIL